MAAIAERVKKARDAGRRNKAVADVNPRRHWAEVLFDNDLPVLSSRQIRVLRLKGRSRRGTPVVCYSQNPDTLQRYRHGSEIGFGLIAKHTPLCLHRQLWNEEWESFKRCPDCQQFLSGGEVVYWPMAERVFKHTSARRNPLWKDTRRTKVPTYNQSADDEVEDKEEYPAFRFWGENRAEPRRPVQLDGGIAPEIDQRRREAAFRYELQNPPYRAPHKKVVELRDAGFDINRIARKLKVSPSTIDNRLREVPETSPPKDLLKLRVKAAGGYSWNWRG